MRLITKQLTLLRQVPSFLLLSLPPEKQNNSNVNNNNNQKLAISKLLKNYMSSLDKTCKIKLTVHTCSYLPFLFFAVNKVNRLWSVLCEKLQHRAYPVQIQVMPSGWLDTACLTRNSTHGMTSLKS